MSDDPMNDLLERATIAQERASAEYAEGLRRYAADRRERIATAAMQGMLACVENGIAPESWADFMTQRAVIIETLRAEIERLTNALREIAYHPTGGVGCNPVQFVLAAREALKAKP